MRCVEYERQGSAARPRRAHAAGLSTACRGAGWPRLARPSARLAFRRSTWPTCC